KENHSEAYPILDFKALDSHNKALTDKVTALQDLNERFRAENEKVKQHYKELYDSIKITRAKTIEKTNSLLTENEKLKAQIKGKMPCVTMPAEKQKVLAPETLREIVEEARVEKPLDSSLAFACLYTKQSQELLEYVIGTCPKDFNKREKKHATTSLTRKKQVTFKETCDTSNNNIQTHVEQQNVQKTNVPMILSTGINSFTKASGSQPMRNTKSNRILSAKSDNKKKVDAHPKNNKSKLKQESRVDSSISYKRTVINLNSNSVCKTCNKCLIYANHDKYVVMYLKYVNATPSVKHVVRKVKQVWKATGKLFTNFNYQWKPTGKILTLGEQCPLTRFTKSKVVPIKKPGTVSTSKIVILKRFSNTSQTPLTRYQHKNKQKKATSTSTPIAAKTQTIDAFVKYTVVSANQQDPTEIRDLLFQTLHHCLFSNAGRTDSPLVFVLRLLKTYDRESLTAQEFREKVHQDS
ncbi:hypothetical protein Tco_0914859, partial [Tanacetum coccineum]